jgi:subtilisin family serine protease
MSLKEQADFAQNYCVQEGEMWDELFHLFQEEGVIVVQAAGNEGYLAVIDPMKRTDATIIVGATNEAGDRASFSNFGEEVDVYAPGDLIAGAGINGKIVKMSGTSMAAPLIAGLVAALLSVDPDADLQRIKGALRASFEQGEEDGKQVHAGRAVEYILQKDEPNA